MFLHHLVFLLRTLHSDENGHKKTERFACCLVCDDDNNDDDQSIVQ